MPAKKIARKISSSKIRRAPMMAEVIEETTIEPVTRMPTGKISPVLYLIPIILAIFALVIWKNKGWIVAATVNGQPVWRWNLEQRFVSRYGTQTLDEMVNEQILKNEAAKQGIVVSDADVSVKISEIEKTLKGKITLKEALLQQGMTMDDFRRQVQIQVLIEKLTARKVTVSDKEIADYISQNKDSLTATDEAGMNVEAKNAILQTKKSQEFQKLFADLKKNAKVTKYL